jgi:predicted alpha/beta-fold hydrolase
MTKSPFSNNGPEVTENMKTLNLQTAPGMVFDVSVEVDDHAPLVLLLYGFGVSRFFWNAQVHAVGEAGYFAVAPNQRGYAAGARPDPTDHAGYRVDRLIGDALDIAAAAGHGDRRFHFVGHDWGASLAWQIADQHPDRLAPLPSCPVRIRWHSHGRWKCRIVSSDGGRDTVGHSWSPTPARTSWHTMRTGCGRG